MDNYLPNFEKVSKEDGKVYGRYNTLTSINPYNCYFMAKYPDGSIIKGNNFINTGWDDIPNGLSELSFVLSTGKVITVPKFRAYLPLIEVSVGMDGSRIFHTINVKCLTDKNVVNYKIVLKETNDSKFKIGDIVLGKESLPEIFNKKWKFTF